MTVIPHPYVPSADSRMVYVAASGNDINDGLSPLTPKKTVTAGMSLLRSGFPDWLHLRKGDIFYSGFGDLKKTGRSALEPLVITSYGEGPRPILKTGTNVGIQTQGSSGTPEVIHSIVICGLHFQAHTRLQGSPEFTGTAGSIGVRFLRQSRDIIFDDLKLEGYLNGIVVQDYEKKGMTNYTVRYCVVTDSYNVAGHSQGIFASGVTGLVIEDNVFDRNGYGDLPDISDDPTIYNHNLYLQWDNSLDVIVRRNVITRAASHGCQLRSGGVFEDNFLWRNPIAFYGGYDPAVPNAVVDVRRNVILEGNDITPTLPKGWGITLKNLVSADIRENIVAHVKTESSNRRSIETHPFATYTDNIVYDWPVKPGVGYGETLETPGPFVDPDRMLIDEYIDNEEDFIWAIRNQSRDFWNHAFSAQSLNDYFREGFASPPPPTPIPPVEPFLAEEEILVKGKDGPTGILYRVKVIGGWLVRYGQSTTFVLDPSYSWVL